MSTAETAASLGISEANVKIRLKRARHMLKAELETKYLPEDIFEFNLIYCDSVINRVMRVIKDINSNNSSVAGVMCEWF